jgi:branched-chain amino acid transport system substrate-binding protein
VRLTGGTGVRLLGALGLLVAGSISIGVAGTASASTSKSTIVVGADITETGGDSTTHDAATTLATWEKYINSTGGIDGHQVKVISADDRNDPATALANVQGFIQNDHAVAILDQSSEDSAFASYVGSAKIPVISLNEAGGTFTYQTNPDFFADGATVEAILYGQEAAAKSEGATNFGVVYCTDVSACAQAVPLWKADASSLGLKLGYLAGASDAAPNYTAQCLAAKQAGVNAMFAAGVPTNTLADDCAQQGYKPLWVGSEGTINARSAKDPNLEGAVSDQQSFPWFLDSTPATKEFHKYMGSYLGKAESPAVVSASWTGAQMFAEAVKEGLAAGGSSTAVTSSTVLSGLYAFHNQTMGGLAPPLTFTQGQPTAVNCWFLTKVKHGTYTAPLGMKPQCEKVSSSSSSSSSG